MEHTALIEFNWTFVMQLIIVLILFLILRKFFFEKVHNFMKEREQSVKDAFLSAEAVNRKADEKMENYTRKIAQYESEGREIIRDAKDKADAKAREIITLADQRANQMMKDAEEEIQREKKKALAEMREEISSIAILAASRILEEDLKSTEKQDQIIDRVIEEAGTSKWQN